MTTIRRFFALLCVFAVANLVFANALLAALAQPTPVPLPTLIGWWATLAMGATVVAAMIAHVARNTIDLLRADEDLN